MHAQKANYPVVFMAKRLKVSVSGYYRACAAKRSAHTQRDEVLLEHIKSIFAEHKGRYGSPRVHQVLLSRGERTSQKRVMRLMRQEGLRSRVRQTRVKTTQSDVSHRKAANVLARDFSAEAPNQKWLGDITYLPTRQGWLYLAVLLDAFSRKVIGYAMSSRIDTQLTLDALNMACQERGLPKGLIHHTDRGSQYTATVYQERLATCTVSMSRKGNCWDNAVSESFFATLKKEALPESIFQTRELARLAIFEYIHTYYNQVRMHSVLGYQAPNQFEHNYARLRAA